MFDEMTRLNNELVNLQRELAIKNQRLEQLVREKNHLLGIVSHDLRDPIASIQLDSGTLKYGQSLNREQREVLDHIEKVSNDMLKLVNDLLEASSIEIGGLKLKPVETDITELLAEAVSFFQPFARKKNIDLKLETHGMLPKLNVDSQKIDQSVKNLISNAIKYSPQNTSVRVVVEEADSELTVCVRDQGPGLPQKETAELFKPFASGPARAPGGERGSGLGLSIVKRFIEAHHGRVWVDSEPGRGSEFCFALPMQR